MDGASSFYLMLSITGLLSEVSCVWLMGAVSKLMDVPHFVLEVGAGMVLGPTVLKLIPVEIRKYAAEGTIVCATIFLLLTFGVVLKCFVAEAHAQRAKEQVEGTSFVQSFGLERMGLPDPNGPSLVKQGCV